MKRLTRDICRQFKANFKRERDANIFEHLEQLTKNNAHSKANILLSNLCNPGPPLHTGLSWIGPSANRSAVTSMIAGDWFLAAHSGNYFAKNLTPQYLHQIRETETAGIQPSQVCLYCWHYRRQISIEDITHVLWDCPSHYSAREDFISALPCTVGEHLALRPPPDRLALILCSADPQVWDVFGAYAARLRQARRKSRTDFQSKSERLAKTDFRTVRAAWRAGGRRVCRHGICFNLPLTRSHDCPCMDVDPNAIVWEKAAKMAKIDDDLKSIFAVRFNATSFERLGMLQAEVRRRRW